MGVLTVAAGTAALAVALSHDDIVYAVHGSAPIGRMSLLTLRF